MSKQRITSQAGFTLIEVGMAALILVVGFIGMIQAMKISSGMMDHARRQTVAAQILTHEIEQLRLENWATIIAQSTATTWTSATSYAVADIVSYNGGRFICVTANTGSAPAQSKFWAADMTWSNSTAYQKSNVVSYGGRWYRCILAHTAQTPSNATYWVLYSGPITNTGTPTTGTLYGANFTVSKTVATLVTGSLWEVTVVVSWSVTTGRQNADSTPLIFTYSRVNTAYFGKNGLNLTYQRS